MCKVTMSQDFLGQKSPPGPLWTGKQFAGQAYGNMLLPDSKILVHESTLLFILTILLIRMYIYSIYSVDNSNNAGDSNIHLSTLLLNYRNSNIYIYLLSLLILFTVYYGL